MNSKDFRENLDIVKKLIEANDLERAISFINRNLMELKKPLKRYFNKSWYSNTIEQQLKILFLKEEYFQVIEIAEKNSKYLKGSKEALLYVKKSFEKTGVFERRLLFYYLKHYIYDSDMLKKFAYIVYESQDKIDKKELRMLKRYCLEFKRDFEIHKKVINTMFTKKDHDIRFITILLNFFYYYPERDEEFVDIIERFVKIIIKRKVTWKRKIFYPVFRFYYESSNDEGIIPYIFSLIKKSNIADEFSQQIVLSIYEKNNIRVDALETIAKIYRDKQRDDEQALKIYSELYQKNPKDIENTKFFVNLLRKRNLIDDENVNIFLDAHSMFDDEEKKSDEYHELIRYLGEYLQSREIFDKRFNVVVEDILRICNDPTSYIYSINFFYVNQKYKKAFFLLERIEDEKIPEKFRNRYYFLFVKVFIILVSGQNFSQNKWRLVYKYLKRLKKYSDYDVNFEIAQFYILERFSDSLPICFFDSSKCYIWNEKCYFSGRIRKIREGMSEREMEIIRGYLNRAQTSEEAKLYYRLFVEDTRYIPIIPGKPVFFCVNIQKLLSSERYHNAIELFKDYPGISDYPGFGFWLGRIFYNLGKYDEAIIYFNDCIKQNPTNAYAYYYRGKSFSKKNLFLVAFNDFQKVVDLKLFNTEFLVEIIRIYINKRYLTDAQKIIDILAKKEENISLANFYKAQVLYYKRKYTEALEAVKKVNEEGDRRIPPRILQVRILFELKELNKGLDIINSLITEIGQDSIFYREALLTRAKLNYELKKYRLVKKDMERAVDLEEKAYLATMEPEYIYIYANACFFVDDVTLARKYLELYRKRKPFDMRSNILLSKIYLNRNLEKKAIGLLRMTWFLSKNKEVLTELIQTSDKIGDPMKVIEYGKKYFRRYSPEKDIPDIYLTNLYKAKKLHTIQSIMGKHEELIQNLYDNSSQKTDWKSVYTMIRNLDMNKDANELIYLVIKKEDLFNIKILFRMEVVDSYDCKEFPSDYFLDGIDIVLYVSEQRNIASRLKYYCDNVYSFADIAITLDPYLSLKELEKRPVEVLKRLGEIIKEFDNIRKRIIIGTSLIDDYLSSMFDISLKEEQYIPQRKGEVLEDREHFYKVERITPGNNFFHCGLKFEYFSEIVRFQYDFEYKREFFTVLLWKMLDKVLPLKNEMFSYADIDFNIIKYFFELANCPLRDKCKNICPLTTAKMSRISMPSLFEKYYDNEIIEIADEAMNTVPLIRGAHSFSFEHRVQELKICLNILRKSSIFYRYDSVLKGYFDDFVQHLSYFLSFFSERLDVMKQNKEMLLLNIYEISELSPRDIFRDYENTIGTIKGFIEFLRKEGSVHINFIRYMSNCLKDLIDFYRNISSDLSLIYFYQSQGDLYVLTDNSSDRLKELIGYHQNQKGQRVLSYRDTLSWFLSRKNISMNLEENTEMNVVRKGLSQVIKDLKHKKYYFSSWDIREMLLINRFIYKNTGKRSMLIWNDIELEDSTFYSMGKDQEIEYATIIISSEKELSGFLHDDIINLMIIDDSGLEKNIADNIGYQKLFVYSREKMDEFSKIPGSTSRTGRDYLNKMTHNTEKRDDAFVLVNTKNQKSLFYNKYLSGEITQVVIRDDSDKEIFDLTAGDFEVLQVDNDG